MLWSVSVNLELLHSLLWLSYRDTRVFMRTDGASSTLLTSTHPSVFTVSVCSTLWAGQLLTTIPVLLTGRSPLLDLKSFTLTLGRSEFRPGRV